MNASASKTPVCLSIAGLDPSGGAGLAADIKTFAAFGCYAAAAITSVTFQNTQAVFGAEHLSAITVRRQIDPVFEDFDVAAVKTGMLPTGEIIEEIARVFDEQEVKCLVLDPVVRSTSGFDLIDDEALSSLKSKLFCYATVLTPNLAEAERISGIKIQTERDYKMAAEGMLELGAASVLIKGGHVSGTGTGLAKDRLFTAGGMTVFEAEFIDSNSTHGTGCTLSSAIAARLAHGDGLEEAISSAKRYVTDAIRTSAGLGRGNSPVNHWAGVKILGER